MRKERVIREMIVSFTSSVLFIAPRNRSGDGWMRKPMRSTKKRGFSVPRISKLQTRLWSRRMATCIIKSFLEIYPYIALLGVNCFSRCPRTTSRGLRKGSSPFAGFFQFSWLQFSNISPWPRTGSEGLSGQSDHTRQQIQLNLLPSTNASFVKRFILALLLPKLPFHMCLPSTAG